MTALEKAELFNQIDDFVAKGWVELSASGWSSPVLFIPKPNGKLRCCLDYRRLITRTEKDGGPISPADKTIRPAERCKIFFTIPISIRLLPTRSGTIGTKVYCLLYARWPISVEGCAHGVYKRSSNIPNCYESNPQDSYISWLLPNVLR